MISGTAPWLSLPRHVLSYDIVCQYMVKFEARMQRAISLMDDLEHVDVQDIRRLTAMDIIATVPKFHAPAHKRECRYTFSLDYLEGTDRKRHV